jgi:PLD-like domain
MFAQNVKNGFSLKAYQGDAKTLLAFDLPLARSKNLAGFTISCKPGPGASYYLYNELQFDLPDTHVQNKTEPAYSTINAPIQKFRWLHVPGNYHQPDAVYFGHYTYTVTPRYFDRNNHLQTINLSYSVSVDIIVSPFVKGKIELGFTRGFVQSQAFASHFGIQAIFKPKSYNLTFDTSQVAGKNSNGLPYTFADEYSWSGFTAREKIFGMLNEVLADPALSLDVFCYDFNEPDIINVMLKLGSQSRVRIILDNSALHHNKTNSKPEDQFETAFLAVAKPPAGILRGKFSRYQHNKVFIVKKAGVPQQVLAGSTNFSITGIYVNSNHVIVFNDPGVASSYENSFNEAWTMDVRERAFVGAAISSESVGFGAASGLPEMNISFSPHTDTFSLARLTGMVNRIKQEKSSVLFAVMDTDPKVKGPVSPALKGLHARKDIFSYGITDTTSTIFLYKPGQASGIEVTGLPGKTLLPPPFNTEKSITIGHQVHHKFIICGFNTPDAVLWCGSSNLAEGGEDQNGDNLIEIHDQDIATAFAIEAFGLIDHFLFRDSFAVKNKPAKTKVLNLYDNDSWTKKYYNKKDLYYKERKLF